jgi:hypothetical protein
LALQLFQLRRPRRSCRLSILRRCEVVPSRTSARQNCHSSWEFGFALLRSRPRSTEPLRLTRLHIFSWMEVLYRLAMHAERLNRRDVPMPPLQQDSYRAELRSSSTSSRVIGADQSLLVTSLKARRAIRYAPQASWKFRSPSARCSTVLSWSRASSSCGVSTGCPQRGRVG